MKSLSFLKKGTLQKIMLLVGFSSCLGLPQEADASVTWLVSEVGSSMVLTTSGTLDVTNTSSSSFTGRVVGVYNSNSTAVYVFKSFFTLAENTGTTSAFDPWILSGDSTTIDVEGHSFGHSVSSLVLDPAFGATPTVITPVTTMTFANTSISDAFGSNLNSGPVLLWTHGGTFDMILIDRAVPVPEPSSAICLGLGLASFMLRRRR